jgi:SAM-dependent methyltransferase
LARKKPKETEFDFQAVFEPDDYLYFYSMSLTDSRTRQELDFLKKKLKLNRPLRILDLACGYGRHALPLAGLGHEVVGVDITPGFLKIAESAARKKRLKVEFICRDMRRIGYGNEFDCALLLYTAFGYFSDADNFKVLKNVARALKPGGIFCFDTFNPVELLKNLPLTRVTEKGKDLMIDRMSFDPGSRRMCNQRIVVRDGQRKDKPFFVRVYEPREIKELLDRSGMRLEKIYGDWSGEKISGKSKRMIVIAQKDG